MRTSGKIAALVCALACVGVGTLRAERLGYPWLQRVAAENALAQRIPPPPGFVRTPVASGSFEDWLRHLPLKPGFPAVFLYDGTKKANQNAHAAVVEIDVGARDLQQCADAVIRLRAEYLFAAGRKEAISFRFTNGFACDFATWAAGSRPLIKGQEVVWQPGAKPDASHASFRKYLDVVFTYAGTASLAKELKAVDRTSEIRGGDVFIHGGSPGHAVIVLDVVAHPVTRQRVFLLAQSYMPAQDVHVLKNPARNSADPWYSADIGSELRTPEWTFAATERMRFAP